MNAAREAAERPTLADRIAALKKSPECNLHFNDGIRAAAALVEREALSLAAVDAGEAVDEAFAISLGGERHGGSLPHLIGWWGHGLIWDSGHDSWRIGTSEIWRDAKPNRGQLRNLISALNIPLSETAK